MAYAGSLLYLDEKVIGPAFHTSSGYAFTGRGAGSLALSQEIKSGEITPNVFESIGAKPIEALEPKFTSWYVQFAASPLVVAYNPKSRFAPELAAIASGQKPIADLFTLMETHGFLLGRTDPNLDPQGQAFLEMLLLAQLDYNLPAGTVAKILGGSPLDTASSSQIFDETALEPRLEAGQLDASSAYLSQAVQLHLHYIKLPPAISLGDPKLKAAYGRAKFKLANGMVAMGKPLAVDITTIGHTDAAAADAFVAYVLSAAGLDYFSKNGYELLKPKLTGPRSAVPAGVLSELAG